VECWSIGINAAKRCSEDHGILPIETKALFGLILLDRLDFFLIADLASVFHSGRYPEFGKDVGLENDPSNDNGNDPPIIHSIFPFFIHSISDGAVKTPPLRSVHGSIPHHERRIKQLRGT
jgi:hypothetical protein